MDEPARAPGETSTPPVYEPPPGAHADAERPASAYLLLAASFIVLAAAIWWVWHRYRHPPAHPASRAAEPASVSRDSPVSRDPGAAASSPSMRSGGGDEVAHPPPSTPVPPASEPRRGPPPGRQPVEQTAPAAPSARSHDAGLRPAKPDAPRADPRTLELVRATHRAIATVGTQAEMIRAVRGAYPSSRMDHGRHRGVEALHQALRHAGRDGALGNLTVGDTDGDGRTELVDPWGNALVYFSPDDYANAQGWAKEADAVATRNATTGQWNARSRFQLWSAGPNGRNENGGGDDVTSWEAR